ncbi:lipase family protein [Nocardia sp. CDC159]|uniref:Lipase family protein n=1 Tax=Nocardia pulmonis TaxID=2951408 RepID=A0A9X2J0U2_9NOCA|nr:MULTISPECIES: lipase family protein [Nocardia]MCM6777385.1 lipase family protein [Nocardia pulmonis]MCM6790270.1 lipase family protein [Nocardia sp. CDC159]
MSVINGDRRGRRWPAVALTTAMTLAAALLLGNSAPAPAQAQPLAPQVDPFYKPPEGFEATEPGTILRSRPVQLAVATILPVRVKSWQLLYRTTDLNGIPTAAVTTVAMPMGANPARHRPLLSAQFYYDSAAPQCAPSYVLQQGTGLAGLEGIHSNSEYLGLAAAMSEGYAVAIPDYEGVNGHLAVAREPGYMVLDSVRAAQRFEPLGLDGANTPVALWGYSGGGMGSGWAAEMQPSYAPELNIKGVALGAPTSDVQSLLHVNGSMFSSLIAIGIASLSNAYPKFAETTNKYLTPEGRALMDRTNRQCLSRNALTAMFVDYQRLLTIPIAQYLALPEIKEVFDSLVLGHNPPTAPMFVYQGVFDEAVPVWSNDRMVKQWCDGGSSVIYKRDHLSEHLTLTTLGMGEAFGWIKGRLAPNAPDQIGCRTDNVVSMFASPDAFVQQTIINLNAMAGALGWPIGPREN